MDPGMQLCEVELQATHVRYTFCMCSVTFHEASKRGVVTGFGTCSIATVQTLSEDQVSVSAPFMSLLRECALRASQSIGRADLARVSWMQAPCSSTALQQPAPTDAGHSPPEHAHADSTSIENQRGGENASVRSFSAEVVRYTPSVQQDSCVRALHESPSRSAGSGPNGRQRGK